MTRGGRHYKRKRDDRETSNDVGVGETVERMSRESRPLPDLGDKSEDDGEGWEKVERSSKRQKKDSNYPSITHSAHARLQSFVKITNLQELVLYLLADGNSPQWVSVRHHKSVKKVVVLMVPGLEADMFSGKIALDSSDGTVTSTEEPTPQPESREDAAVPEDKDAISVGVPQKPRRKLNISPDDYYPTKLVPYKLPPALAPLAEMFSHIWPDAFPLYAMLNSPIPKTKEEKKAKGPQFPREGRTWQYERTAITEFLATKEELAENGFALHPAHLHTQAQRDLEEARRHKWCQSKQDGWIDMLDITSMSEGDVPESEIEKGSVTRGRKVIVIDCEMVTTTVDKFSLARVSLIDWDGNVILDELVRPPGSVKDYLTQYSGITKEMLDPVTTTLSDIHQKLSEILTPQTILAGHSLDSDLKALKMSYPFIIDTALLYPHPKGPPQKSSLKWLSQKYLSREIQNRGPKGHDSVEDALACLDLIKQKCEKGKTWGTPEATGESIFKRLSRSERPGPLPKHESANDHAESNGRTGAVVDWGDPRRGFGAAAAVSIACENDGDVVEGVKRAVTGEEDNIVRKGGCDFVWGRLRELEALRGWYNRTKSPDAAERLAKVLSANEKASESVVAAPAAESEQAAANGTSEPPAVTSETDGAETTDINKTITNTPSGDPSASAPASAPAPDLAVPAPELSTSVLATAVQNTISHIQSIWDSLPPQTAFVVYSGSGDPRELRRMQALHQEYRTAYQTMKWDELPVKWTDTEEQALKAAAGKARSGIGFVTVK
ncbi:hypothetical protein H2203_003783 [Taxawa tesnikishii (nom. ined.)]|nr:hypothetical protein H2203_003783 [Dothideales sp. JES 119]